tara:strand:- start:839 stop:1096 length:258 start_codon:yes stop_codon:yes gene_type:complete
MSNLELLKEYIRTILIEEKEENILGEPDLSDEEDRTGEEIDEISFAASISGPMGPISGKQGTTGVPDSRAKKKKRKKSWFLNYEK